ncbi:DUF503 domain-containing protein [Pseudothermotoga sp. U03pept]|uniref:DUF503 domain-containing protein n=1 Tax=Pseudothermotoga sp. U03pept TaxID=3447012 RepID=UPI003F0720F3
MHVAVLSYTIRLFGINSLKEKRSLIKGLINEIRTKFNVSICELDLNDSKNWAQIGVAVISSAQDVVDRVVEGITSIIENTDGVQIAEIEREGW